MSLKKFINTLQLSPIEEKCFLKVIELGSSAASDIAKALDLPRNTARDALDTLSKKGTLSRIKEKNRFLYLLESVDALKLQIEKRKQAIDAEFDGQLLLLESARSEFNTKHKQPLKPRVRLFTGLNGIKQLYEDTLDAEGGICSWASFDENDKVLPAYFQSYYKRRAEKGIKMRSIHPDSKLARLHQGKDKSELRKSYIVPKNKLTIVPEIQVYNNKLNIVSWEEKIGVLIESQQVADAVQAIFNLCIELLETKNKSSKSRKNA